MVTRVRIRFPIVHPKIAQRASHVAHVDFGIKLFSSTTLFQRRIVSFRAVASARVSACGLGPLPRVVTR